MLLFLLLLLLIMGTRRNVVLRMLSKVSVVEVFMRHFENMSSASGPQIWELPVISAGAIPSFRPPLLPNPGKILRAPMLLLVLLLLLHSNYVTV